MSVERRVSTLEQRLYTIDSNISQLQQQIMMMSRASAAPAGTSADVQQLRLELDLLRSRINQIECGVAKLDDRDGRASLLIWRDWSRRCRG
jgi:prefoldin subunit 5